MAISRLWTSLGEYYIAGKRNELELCGVSINKTQIPCGVKKASCRTVWNCTIYANFKTSKSYFAYASVHLHIYMCILYILTCTYIHIHRDMSACVCVCIHLCIRGGACMCARARVCMVQLGLNQTKFMVVADSRVRATELGRRM